MFDMLPALYISVFSVNQAMAPSLSNGRTTCGKNGADNTDNTTCIPSMQNQNRRNESPLSEQRLYLPSHTPLAARPDSRPANPCIGYAGKVWQPLHKKRSKSSKRRVVAIPSLINRACWCCKLVYIGLTKNNRILAYNPYMNIAHCINITVRVHSEVSPTPGV